MLSSFLALQNASKEKLNYISFFLTCLFLKVTAARVPLKTYSIWRCVCAHSCLSIVVFTECVFGFQLKCDI